MDEDNTFIVDKTRCPFYKKKAITEPKAEDFQPFKEWLAGEKNKETAAPKPAPAAAQPKAEAPKPQAAPAADPAFKWQTYQPHFEPYIARDADLYAQALKECGIKALSEQTSEAQAKTVYKTVKYSFDQAAANAFEPPPPAAQQPQQQDASLTALLARIKGIQSITKVFAELKQSCIDAMGDEDGQMLYYAALNKEGTAHANKFPSTEHARRAASAIWHALVDHAKGAAA